MKTPYRILTLIFILIAGLPASGQKLPANYGNIPDELVAYDRYMKAYKYHFLEPMKFYGAGREKLPPTNLTEVRIGFLGPLEGSIIQDLGKQMLQGSILAIEEANKKGGYKGTPFKLMIHNDVGLWGAAANEVVKMDDEGVWAWLGTIDDINSHVGIRATLKLEIPNVNTGDPDPTFTETNIPWVVRTIPDDRQSSYVLVDQIFNKDKHNRVAVIRANNRYGRVGTLHFNRSATRIGFPIIIEERFGDGETDFTAQIERVKKTSPDAILVWGNAKESALILKQLRELGMNQPVYGSDRMVNEIFLKTAGDLAEGIITTCQYNPESNDPKFRAFKENYTKRFGQDPDVFAAHAYDGMNVIIEAIKKAGLNRALIRDVLTDLKTFQGYQGVTGPIVFDGSWNNIRPIYLAKVSNGKFHFSPAPKWEKENVIYKKARMAYQ
ncbi:MAG: amino acid ABC transporter substrate-binding protein [Bacteroidales bacterium]|jgi:ABC-type branched-subunit amino acid transport system substrate-binding protein|nr:amino acid ABC transporter substrate-binding protein [Bacteroidales bacterium]